MPVTSRARSRLARFWLVAALVAATAGLAASTGTATATSPACGDTSVYKPDGSAWVCTFDDEFNGSGLDPKQWTVQQTATSGFTTGSPRWHVCYTNSPDNVSVSGGDLALTVRRASRLVLCGAYSSWITGGTVSTYAHFKQTYGRFEVRAKFPDVRVPGLQETLWLWPANSLRYGPEPSSGEIDFAEAYSQHPALMIPYIHYRPRTYDPTVTSGSCTITLADFHTYDLTWTPATMTIAVDGKTCLVDSWHPAWPLTAPEPFDQPFFLVLTQALGRNTNAYNPYATPLPATTYVDYVRVWK